LNFARTFDRIDGFLDREGFSHALVGALGLHAYGLTRATSDLDLATETRAQAPLIAFLVSEGYRTLHLSPGFSNHLHPDPAFGRVDVVYISGETSRKIFEGCREFALGGRSVRVPRPEHLAAMKVQAMKNDPSRSLQDMADIRFLLTLPGIDKAEVRGYFDRNGLGDRYEEIERLS
jgi:hypothetical protein